MAKKRKTTTAQTSYNSFDDMTTIMEFIEYIYKIIKDKIGKELFMANNLGKTTAIIGLLIFAILIIVINPIAIVGVGERGVKVTLGKVSPTSFVEGVHVVTPLISKIYTMDVKTQKKIFDTQVYTKDIQQARITYVANYNLQPENVHKMYREVGKDYENVILIPALEGTIKDVIGKWNAQDLVANRERATDEILLKLQQQLNEKYINVTDFQMTEIKYSDTFEKAIESKVTAEQEALKAKNKTVQVQEEARQKVISAEAEAKSMSIRANALTQNKALVEYEAVQKWDGQLPEYMMGNSIPFINMSPKK